MKIRLIIFCISLCAALVAAQGIGYKNAGMGFQLGLVVTDNDGPHFPYWHYDGRNDDIDFGFNFGVHGFINFRVGAIGEAQYRPNIDTWFGFENDGVYDHVIVEIGLNFFDTRYYPPIPQHIAVRPYVGFAPAIIIDIYHWEEDGTSNDDTDTEAEIGGNIYCGADFRISQKTCFFLETRGKFGDWDVFKFMGGMSFVIW